MNDFYVYMYLRSKSSKNGPEGSPYYVGKGRGNRAYDKKHRSKPPTDLALIIFVSKDMFEHDAHQLEMLLIYIHGRINIETGCLANLTDGGEGLRGHIPSEDSKRKRSEFMKANPNRGNEVCPKWPKGKPRTEETKEKQRQSWTPEMRQAASDFHKGHKWLLGKKRGSQSEEQKKSHSERMKGRPSPCGMKGKVHSEETKLKMHIAQEKRKLSLM